MTEQRRTDKLRCKGIPVFTTAARYYDGPMALSPEWKAFLKQHGTPAKRNKYMTQARAMRGNKLRLISGDKK